MEQKSYSFEHTHTMLKSITEKLLKEEQLK